MELRRDCVGDSAFDLSFSARASASAAGLAAMKESVTSCIATFRRNCGSCIVVLHVGHFPSVTMHLRMHREQKVWKQEVMIALVKNSLHIWQRREASRGAKEVREVLCQSVGSEMSVLSSIGMRVMLLSLRIRNHEKARRDISLGVDPIRV